MAKDLFHVKVCFMEPLPRITGTEMEWGLVVKRTEDSYDYTQLKIIPAYQTALAIIKIPATI
jgi:hypothetical protein